MQTVSRTAEQKRGGLTVARILLELRAVNFRPQEPYTLTSGWKSPVYVDCRKVISHPRARRKVTELAVELVEREIGFATIGAIAGGETAGIPYAAWLADALGLPMQYVRKQPKGFGRMAQIEGDLDEGTRVLLVEDLATDGRSKLGFQKALTDAGADCRDALVVFYYGVFPQSVKALEECGLALHFLATWWDVLEVAETEGHFDKASINEVRAFLHNPAEWSGQHGGRADGG